MLKNKEAKTIRLAPSIKHQLENLHISMSAAYTQAIANAYADDSLLVKALKRRLALHASPEDNTERTCITQGAKIQEMLLSLSQRAQLDIEEIRRLAIEAYLFKL